MDWNSSWAAAGGSVWFSIALMTSGLAGVQGRTKIGWFILGMIFGPLALLILVLMTQPIHPRD